MVFGLCLYFGESVDVAQGDIAGFVALAAHVPVAMIVNRLIPWEIYSDVFTLQLVLLGALCWTCCWAVFFALIKNREEQLAYDPPKG